MWLMVWLPVVAANAASGTVARRDLHALLTVRPAARPALVPLGAAVLVVVGVLSGSLPAALLPWWATAVLLPLVVDGAGVARRAARASTGSADRARARTRAGQAVWRIELYAAHPAGDSHGSRLASQLLEHVPAGVWLVTTAADAALAEHYRSRYGFRAWDPARPLLLERPPTGSATARAGVLQPFPEQQQPGQ